VTKWYIYRKRGVLALSGDTSPSVLLVLLVCALVSLRPMTSIGTCDFAIASLSLLPSFILRV
jgi:hypothetical protein